MAGRFLHFDAVVMPMALVGAFAMPWTLMGANSSDLNHEC